MLHRRRLRLRSRGRGGRPPWIPGGRCSHGVRVNNKQSTNKQTTPRVENYPDIIVLNTVLGHSQGGHGGEGGPSAWSRSVLSKVGFKHDCVYFVMNSFVLVICNMYCTFNYHMYNMYNYWVNHNFKFFFPFLKQHTKAAMTCTYRQLLKCVLKPKSL